MKIKFGSSGEYEIKAIKIKNPIKRTQIPKISINLFVMNVRAVFDSFFISISDESKLPRDNSPSRIPTKSNYGIRKKRD